MYRTIEDLQKLIAFSATKKGKTGIVVGGGLLGLEAAKAMLDLQEFGKIKVIESFPYVLARQVDSEGIISSHSPKHFADIRKAVLWWSIKSEN